MSDSLKRSHSCGLLTKEAAGEQVVFMRLGWPNAAITAG